MQLTFFFKQQKVESQSGCLSTIKVSVELNDSDSQGLIDFANKLCQNDVKGKRTQRRNIALKMVCYEPNSKSP